MRKRSNSLFYGAVAVLIIVCAFVYCWKSLVPKYYSQRSEIDMADEELKAATNKLESIKTTGTTLQSIASITDQLFVAIPGDKDAPNLITELEAIATKHNLIIPAIQIEDRTSTGNTQTSNANAVPISFSVNGTFEDLNAFVGTIEKDIRFMNINSITMASDEENQGILSLSMQIEAYKRAGSGKGTGTTAPASSSNTASPTASTAGVSP